MQLYIVKKGHSISTGKGIVGAPVDLKHPTEKEIVTVKHFKNGQTGLDAVLASEKCVLELFGENESASIPDDDTRPNLKAENQETKPIEKPVEKLVENKGAQKK